MFDDELMDDQVVLGDEGSVEDPENDNPFDNIDSPSQRQLPSTSRTNGELILSNENSVTPFTREISPGQLHN